MSTSRASVKEMSKYRCTTVIKSFEEQGIDLAASKGWYINSKFRPLQILTELNKVKEKGNTPTEEGEFKRWGKTKCHQNADTSRHQESVIGPDLLHNKAEFPLK